MAADLAELADSPAPADPAVPNQPPIANVPGRLGSPLVNRVVAVVGLPWQRRLAKAALLVPRIRYYEATYGRLPDAELRTLSLRLRGRARGGESLNRLVPEAFGLACVAIRRVKGYVPFDVQLAAGVVMHYGGLVELATGEGKTLSAVAPAYLNALPGKGVHVTTVNDYLARRDAEEVGAVYKRLGLTVGCVLASMDDDAKRPEYKADITYGTSSEFGFDFLRDRLKLQGGQAAKGEFWEAWTGGGPGRADPRVQRDLHFALVDEADSVFVDAARTPLIIAQATRQATPEEAVVYHWADKLVRQMVRDEHFKFDPKKDGFELTDSGRRLARYANPPFGKHSHAMDKLLDAVERGIHAHHRFARDQHYLVSPDQKIVLIDEGSGRATPGRMWRDGLHQAVEAKEGVPINTESDHAAQITYQNFYRLYHKLAGMSGTLAPNFWEVRRVYRRWVTCIPTNRPVRRVQLPDQVFPTEDAKFAAVVGHIRRLRETGRPVLVGTRSLDRSEKLSALLADAGIPHEVLNARQDAKEAEVIARAGQWAQVTVATNMAGRGTDIKLGPGVADAGGLHVLGTERHDSLRVDRQLAGRAGRQGDPGSAQFVMSLEDELLEGLGMRRAAALKAVGRRGGARDWGRFRRLFYRAQRRLERKYYKQRLDLMNYDKSRQDLMEDLGADPYVD